MSLRACLAIAIVSGSAFSQISDVTPPVLQSFSFSPTSIDTRPGPRNLTFTLQVSDDLAGTAGISLILNGPSGQWRSAFSSRTAGTPLLGTYLASLNFPQFTASGEWRLEIYLIDAAGNRAQISARTLLDRGFPAILNVISTPDVTPPRIETLELTPVAVNTSTADATVTVRMRLTDTETGLEVSPSGCECNFEILTLTSPSGRQRRGIGNGEFQLISGSRNDGIWRASLSMPRYSEPGVWTALISLYDSARNGLHAPPSELAAAGLPSGITVSSSPADLEMPTLTSFSLSPPVIDTALAPQILNFSIGVRDNLGGVDFVNQTLCPCYFRGVSLRSPSGNQSASNFFNNFTQVSGNALNGVWTTTAFFPRYAEAGTWSVDVYLRDRNSNERRMTRSQLEAAGFPSSLVVIRPSYVPDGTVESTGGSVQDEVFGARARITIPPRALPGRTTISIDVLEVPPNIPVPQGFSSPGSRFVNIDLIPHPRAPIGPPGYTITIPLVNPLPQNTAMTLMRLDPISGNLVRAASVVAGDVIGRVDAGGQTATFTGVASFSTVVGLLSSEQKPGDLNGDGVVSCADVAIVRAAFGKRAGQAGFDGRADVNRDGVVNVSDLSYVLRQLPTGALCQ